MQRLLLTLSRPFVQLISSIQKALFKKSSARSGAYDNKAKEKAKIPSREDINAAIIKAWYAPSTSAQIYYYDSANSK